MATAGDPDAENCPLPESVQLPAQLAVYDVIYNPRRTRLLARAKACGCRTSNGLSMLLYQGAEAFRIWTGQDMPVSEVRRLVFPEG